MHERGIPTGAESQPRHNPNIIRLSDVADAPLNTDFSNRIQELFTPRELLTRIEFDKPQVIIPVWYPTFEAVYAQREKIRTLQLLPVKNDEQYAYYHAQSKESLTALIEGYLVDTPFAFATNAFPYYLPDNLQQDILWMRDSASDDRNIANFLAQCMTMQGKSPENAILFERPMRTRAHLVRGTVPEYRHLHVWTEKSKTY